MGFYSLLKSFRRRFINEQIKSDFGEATKEDFHRSSSEGVELQVPYQTYATSQLALYDQSPLSLDFNRFTFVFLDKGINPRRRSL